MVYGNPNCRPTGQNCPFGNCCTYNGQCAEDWTVPDACYYPYYNYNDGITKQIAIGLIAGFILFVAIVLAVGVIIWFRKHSKTPLTRKPTKKQQIVYEYNIDTEKMAPKRVKNKELQIYQNQQNTQVIIYEEQ